MNWMEKRIHLQIICPMCEKPVTTEAIDIKDGGQNYAIYATCDCPGVHVRTGHLFKCGPDLNFDEYGEINSKTAALAHVRNRQAFRDGFDMAMRVVHKFAETHLPTIKPEVEQ